MAFTDNEKWQAVLECDETFDDQFYYGVKTTGVFCRPSCKSKTPLRKNVEFFDTIESAFAFGLRPCKRCRPDRLTYHPKSELIEQAKNIYDTYFDDDVKLSLGIKQLNISQNHLIRIFHQQLNLTPGQYLQKLRIEKAMELLANPARKIVNIAFICGFGSLSNFNVCFKKEVGFTPTEYRKQKKRS